MNEIKKLLVECQEEFEICEDERKEEIEDILVELNQEFWVKRKKQKKLQKQLKNSKSNEIRPTARSKPAGSALQAVRSLTPDLG